VLGDGAIPAARLATIAAQVLVMTGSGDPHLAGLGGFFDEAADALAACVPGAERRTLTSGHVADPKVVGPVLTRFFR
jgi:hypothetical protein